MIQFDYIYNFFQMGWNHQLGCFKMFQTKETLHKARVSHTQGLGFRV